MAEKAKASRSVKKRMLFGVEKKGNGGVRIGISSFWWKPTVRNTTRAVAFTTFPPFWQPLKPKETSLFFMHFSQVFLGGIIWFIWILLFILLLLLYYIPSKEGIQIEALKYLIGKRKVCKNDEGLNKKKWKLKRGNPPIFTKEKELKKMRHRALLICLLIWRKEKKKEDGRKRKVEINE